jgi:hypothetical protein
MRLPNREGVALPCPPEAPTLLTSAMTNGRSSSPSFPQPYLADVPELTKRARYCTPSSSTCSGAGVLGACSRTTSACRGRECLPLLQGLAHGDGTWEHIHTALRQRLRRLLGREPTPSAAIIDSQRVGQGVRHAVFTRPFRTSVTVGLSQYPLSIVLSFKVRARVKPPRRSLMGSL